MKQTAKFTGQLVFMLALFVILFTYAMFQGGFVSWFLFDAFLPIILYHFGLLLYPIGRWKIERQVPKQQASTGENLTMSIRLKRKVPFPFYYLIVEEQLPDTLDRIDSPRMRYYQFDTETEHDQREPLKTIIYPWFKRTIDCSFTLDNVPRGEHHLNAVRVRTGDVFGFIKKEHIFPVKDTFTVKPATRQLRVLEQKRGLSQGSAATSGTSMEQTNVVTGVRAYVPGDKFSWIDWKQTARKNEMMTKEFEQEHQTETMVILDAHRYDPFNQAAFEAAVEVSLSMMTTMQNKGMEAGFLSLGADTYFSSVHQNRGKIDQISSHLARIQPGGSGAFTNDLKTYMDRLPEVSAIIVTTHVDEYLEQMLRRVVQQGRRVVVVFIYAQNTITDSERSVLYQMQSNGVIVNELTEKELIRHTIEVGT